MTIRKATRDDLDPITRMCVTSMKATYGGFFTDEQMKPWIEGGETERYVASALPGMLVDEDSGTLRGVVALKDDLVDLMWVALEHRGRGVGRGLLEEAERALAGRGHRAARLEVFEPNGEAIAFYAHCGWTEKDRYPDPMAGVKKVLMGKSLDGKT